MRGFAEEALELHLRLIDSCTLSAELRICDGDNFLVRHRLALLEAMWLLLGLLMINCIS